MSNYCFHKSLLSEVENAELVKLGEFKIDVVNNDQSTILPFAMVASSPFTCKIVGDGYFYKGTINNQTDITTEIADVTTTSGYRLSTGTYSVSIIPKYGLTEVNFGSSTPVDVSASANWKLSLDIDSLKYCTLTKVACGNGNNAVSFVGNLSSITEESILQLYNTGIAGKTEDLAKYNIINGSFICCPGPNISGSIEDFIENVTSIYYSKTLTAKFRTSQDNCNVKFNGYLITSLLKLVFDASGNCEVRNYDNNALLATYTKSTGSWVYE